MHECSNEHRVTEHNTINLPMKMMEGCLCLATANNAFTSFSLSPCCGAYDIHESLTVNDIITTSTIAIIFIRLLRTVVIVMLLVWLQLTHLEVRDEALIQKKVL